MSRLPAGFLRTLVLRCLVCAAIAVAAWAAGRLGQVNVRLGFLLLVAAMAAVLSLVLGDHLWPEGSRLRWQVRLDDEEPRLPREHRAVRYADIVRGAEPSNRFSFTDLRSELADIAADRLVRHHGADAAHPFVSASGLLSPQLLAYLTGDTATPVRRTTLATYLKEIEHL